MIYLQEHKFNVNDYSLHINFFEAIYGVNSSKWISAMKDKLASMYKNDVWDLVEFCTSCKSAKCKWVFKTKQNAQGEFERYKVRLAIKGYTQKELTIKKNFHKFQIIKTHFELI